MTRILAFTGPAGAGKDTCGRWFHDNYQYVPVAFAYPLKAALQAMGFGWPQTQEEKEAIIPWLGKSYRYLAQTLGTEWGRELIDPDMWVKLMEHLINQRPSSKFVVTDLRFENEAAMIRRNGGVVIHIEGRKLGTGNDAHKSEQPIATHENDFTICNDGTLEDLYTECGEIVKWFSLQRGT